MIAEAIIGGVTTIVLGVLWYSKSIVDKVMEKEAAKNVLPEKIYTFVAPEGKPYCHLCGARPNVPEGTSLTRIYENGYLRRNCSNCNGSYLMELATK